MVHFVRPKIRQKRGSVLLLAFWCLMATSMVVYAVYHKALINCRRYSHLVEAEQAYWTATGASERTVGYLIEQSSSNEPRYISLLKGATHPIWFKNSKLGVTSFDISLKPYTFELGVQGETGLFNINHFPNDIVRDDFFNSIPSIRNPSQVITDIYDRQFLRDVEDNRRSGNNGRWYPFDTFRHPLELLERASIEDYHGSDENENLILDPFDDDYDQNNLTLGLYGTITTYTESKVNPYVCSNENLKILLRDFSIVESEVRKNKDRGDWVEPFDYHRLYGSGDEQSKYMDFSRNLTNLVDTISVTVQVYDREQKWLSSLRTTYTLAPNRSVSSPSTNSTTWTPLCRRYEQGM